MVHWKFIIKGEGQHTGVDLKLAELLKTNVFEPPVCKSRQMQRSQLY
jgi:hypothetical protein